MPGTRFDTFGVDDFPNFPFGGICMLVPWRVDV